MKSFFSFCLFLCSLGAFAQGEANLWYFGNNAGLDFNTVPPTALTNGRISTFEGCSTFSDSSGNLLFYSDGKTIWNRNHDIMPNGSNLAGSNSSSQSAMIIPKPGNPNLYYLFTVGAQSDGINLGFNYYTVNMALDGGLGNISGSKTDLTQEKNPQFWTEKVAAVKGAECQTYWVVSYTENEFFAYKIDISGVATTPVRSSSAFFTDDPRGYLKISPNGERVAIAHQSTGRIYVYDFDDATGEITNETRLYLPTVPNITSSLQPNQPYGLEFSPNSEKIYVHASNGGPFDNDSASVHFAALIQYDITLNTSAAINASRFIIDARNGYRGALQLGPDNKIYRTTSQSYNVGLPYLSVIENPNEEGDLTNYKHNAVDLNGRRSTQGLPPFIASIFSQIDLTSLDVNGNDILINNQVFNLCLGDVLEVIPEPLTPTATYAWFFNDDPVPFSTQANLTISNIDFPLEGQYKLEAKYTDQCGNPISLEGEFDLNISEIPIANPMDDISICDDNNDGLFEFDLAQNESQIIGTQSDVEVNYFLSLNDAQDNKNPLPVLFTSGSTTIYARIQSRDNANCYDITNFEIVVFERPLPLTSGSITNLSYCDNTSFGSDTDGIITLDLTERATEILNNQSSTNFQLTYFTDAAYTNQIPNPAAFVNTIPNGQTIYVRMTNVLESNCFADTSFELEVFELPSLNPAPFVLEQCDDDFDGFNQFNLTEINEELISNTADVTFSFYESQSDAESGVDEITEVFAYQNQIVNSDNTVWARMENTNGCFRVAQIELIVKPSAIPSDFLVEYFACDDGNDTTDGIATFDFSGVTAQIEAIFPLAIEVFYYETEADAISELNAITNPNNFENINSPGTQQIWVRADSSLGNDCLGYGHHITLTVDPLPQFDVDPTAIVCLNLPPITLETYNAQGDYTYEWTDESGAIISTEPTVQVSSGGIYTVIATSQEGCESLPRTVDVSESVIATITEEDVTITDDSRNNTITINNDNNNLGIGDYEFALDDNNGGISFYQDEPYFDNVAPGIRTIYVRDKNACGVATLEVSVIGFPDFFTPNDDGVNDTWQIQGVGDGFYGASLIYIFDRYGKIITKIDPNSEGWDGIYNGEILPSTDYWFTAELIDQNGNIRMRNGHFSLIRR